MSATPQLYREGTNEPVTLPAELETFRGDRVTVVSYYGDGTGGSSGRVVTDTGRTFFPGVVRCYIAYEPKAEKP